MNRQYIEEQSRHALSAEDFLKNPLVVSRSKGVDELLGLIEQSLKDAMALVEVK